ncbi:MAG: PASTA domain-containing protein [Nitrospirae bacterium]|nr:PASTA domain-containing protein [Nitrospirota bacterium]
MRGLIKIIGYVVVLLFLGIVAGHFTFQLLSFSRTVVVPDLKGKEMMRANDILRNQGLYIRLEGEDYDPAIPQGNIIRQDILSGSTVKEGREIGIVVSKGPRIQYVPDIVGQPLDAAEAILKEKGIRIGKILYVHSEKTSRNVVLAQRPETNERGADIFSVIVSLGDFGDQNKIKGKVAAGNVP